jgi:hypothetical protein
MVRPRSWGISLECLQKGIDNARVDCLLSPRFRERATLLIERLVREGVASLDSRVPEQIVTSEDLAQFRRSYLALFESALDRHPVGTYREILILLQLTLIKLLLQLVEREVRTQRDMLKVEADTAAADPARGPAARERLLRVTREADAVQRRVLNLLFRQIRALETGQLNKLRLSVIGKQWPIPERVLFNPLLAIPDPLAQRALTGDYPVAWLGECQGPGWLARVQHCLSQVLDAYLPLRPDDEGQETPEVSSDRRDQGELRGFLGTEILLRRFVPRDEYRQGAATWLDHPENIRLLIGLGLDEPSAGAEGQAPWRHPAWSSFQREVRCELVAALDRAGLLGAAQAAYALPALRAQVGPGLPAAVVLEYAQGAVTRRQLAQRLAAARTPLDVDAVQQGLERALDPRRRREPDCMHALARRLAVDHLTLRRDLKLAYKTFEVLDRIQLLEAPGELRLSRSNGSLHEFPLQGEIGPQARRMRAHAVIKADVRGSTLITEELRARGLNPASHFSLNFFNPVNALLAEFGAEKLFVEGDAVILALYEYLDQSPRLAVARACRLACRILQVVGRQNLANRQLDLPELELGLGVSYSAREPNFLYDEGRRIMISSAINASDRLSACSGLLRRSGFAPSSPAFRIAVVRDAVGGERAGPGRDLLTYNVNGVKLDEHAFLKLQEELPMQQVRVPEGEAWDSLFFVGMTAEAHGGEHALVVRHAPVVDWYGDGLGLVEPERRHFFELVVDDALAARVRGLAQGGKS